MKCSYCTSSAYWKSTINLQINIFFGLYKSLQFETLNLKFKGSNLIFQKSKQKIVTVIGQQFIVVVIVLVINIAIKT